MRDGVPLNLVLEPGDYRVTWFLPSRTGELVELEGEVTLSPERRPRGDAYGDVPVEWESQGGSRSAGFPQTYEAAMVVGRMLNGLTVVMLGVGVELWMADRAILTAHTALVGRVAVEPGSDVRVKGFTVQIEGLDAIAGVAPIKKVKLPKWESGKRYLEWDWGAQGNPDSTQTWSDDEAEVELRFLHSSMAPEGFFFRINFSPVVDVTLTTPASFEEVHTQWIEALRRIVALGTTRPEKITYLGLNLDLPEGDTFLTQVYRANVSQEVFASRNNDILKIEPTFMLKPHGLSLLNLVRQWQLLDAEQHPLLETYAPMMFAPEQHPRSTLLLLLQALEGMHGHETRDAREARELAHNAARDEVITELSSLASATTLRFIRRHLAKRSPAGLQDALKAAIGETPVDISDQLARSELVAASNAIRDSESPFDALRHIRNDLAHGTRGYDVYALHQVAGLLDSVVRVHLLRLLGFSIEVQRRQQERRR